MERMEHFRDARVLENGSVVLDGVEGYLGFHQKSHGRKQWYGYFELTSDQHLQAGARYQLVLKDGRTGEINAADFSDSGRPGEKVHVAEYYVIGEMRNQRRGLRDDSRHSFG